MVCGEQIVLLICFGDTRLEGNSVRDTNVSQYANRRSRLFDSNLRHSGIGGVDFWRELYRQEGGTCVISYYLGPNSHPSYKLLMDRHAPFHLESELTLRVGVGGGHDLCHAMK